MALLVVLERLTPAERTSFLPHDVFGMSFAEVAGVVGRSPAAVRQLASRARQHVDGAGRPTILRLEARGTPGDDHGHVLMESFRPTPIPVRSRIPWRAGPDARVGGGGSRPVPA
jgi:RNA polymerase sigma-70 factor (ECF subfamily)